MNTIGAINLSEATEVIFYLDTYREKHFANIRKFIKSKKYTGPTKSGIKLNKKELQIIYEALRNLSPDLSILEECELCKIKIYNGKFISVMIKSFIGSYGIDIREYIEQKGFYGFHTFRRGRMITTYDKIGFEPHPTLARIIGEINMDHVPVTHNKREFIKESLEYKEVEAAMREELKELTRLARRKATQDIVTPEIKNEVDIWKDKISESLRSEEFKNYTSRLKNIEPVPDPNGTEIKDTVVEKRSEDENKPNNEPQTKDERTRNPKETHEQKRHVIGIKGKNIEFNHKFAQLGVEQPWKTHTFNQEKGLEIFTNTDFPAYLVTNDKVFYAVIHIAEAISEVLVQAAQEDIANVDELKELILRKSSELKAQL